MRTAALVPGGQDERPDFIGVLCRRLDVEPGLNAANRGADLPAADRILKRVLILDPDHTPALNLLFLIYETSGHPAGAPAYLRRPRKLVKSPILLCKSELTDWFVTPVLIRRKA
jgi:hypothetical protein